MESVPATVQVVAGVVLQKDGKFLLVQEKQPKAYKQWNLPAGKVDKGETIEEAAVREAKEEVGYRVRLGKELPVIHPGMPHPVLHAFAAEIVDGELKFPENELLDAQWFTYEELQQLDLRNTEYILGAIDACRG
jgi:8-oxo-dGTP pyrophosphatase MutT (NUDIX family)